MAAEALPDGTPVIISSSYDGTVRVWRMANGTPLGKPLTDHNTPVWAVAAGTPPDGTPVIISGGHDNTVRVWRMADGTPVGEPVYLPESVGPVSVHDNVVVTAAGTDIALHQLALPQPIR